MSDADWIEKLAETLARGVESQATPDAAIAAIAETIRQAHAAHLAKLDAGKLAEEIADLAQYHHSIVMMGDDDNSFPVEMFEESISTALAPLLETIDEHEKNLTLLRRLIGECTDKREVEALENKKLLERNKALETALKKVKGRIRHASNCDIYADRGECDCDERSLARSIDALLKEKQNG